MRSLLIVTYIDFWRTGSGHRARLTALLHYLKDKLKITVFYAGIFLEQDRVTLKRQYPEITLGIQERESTLTFKECAIQFKAFITDKVFDAVIVEYIEMSFVLPFLHPETLTILDTHDLVSNRIESFKDHNLPYDGITLTSEEELEIFDCYDLIMLIQKSDYATIKSLMNNDRILLVPHPVSFSRKKTRKSVRRIGFLASSYAPNIDAIKWFLNHVWPLIQPLEIEFHVFGNICAHISAETVSRSTGVSLRGFVSDLASVYETCDIIVNPVRCGAGLKIKNVEALGNGLPLVTTPHGAIGMEDGINTAFLLADSPAGFEKSIIKLFGDYNFRKRLAAQSYQYAQRNFTEDICYKPLLRAIEGSQVMK